MQETVGGGNAPTEAAQGPAHGPEQAKEQAKEESGKAVKQLKEALDGLKLDEIFKGIGEQIKIAVGELKGVFEELLVGLGIKEVADGMKTEEGKEKEKAVVGLKGELIKEMSIFKLKPEEESDLLKNLTSRVSSGYNMIVFSNDGLSTKFKGLQTAAVAANANDVFKGVKVKMLSLKSKKKDLDELFKDNPKIIFEGEEAEAMLILQAAYHNKELPLAEIAKKLGIDEKIIAKNKDKIVKLSGRKEWAPAKDEQNKQPSASASASASDSK